MTCRSARTPVSGPSSRCRSPGRPGDEAAAAKRRRRRRGRRPAGPGRGRHRRRLLHHHGRRRQHPGGRLAARQTAITAATPAAGGTVAPHLGRRHRPGAGHRHLYGHARRRRRRRHCSPTLTVTTCTDSGLEPGTYTYVVTAKWRSWTTISSSKAATVTVGPADHFVLDAASSTPTAGAADNLTITAKDAKGGTVTTYIGSHNLTFSGASASPNGTVPTVADSSGAPSPSATPRRSTSPPASPRSPRPPTAR